MIALVLLCQLQCTEPFTIVQNGFEPVLVVEATITNEVKRQMLKISQTVGLEDFGQRFVSGADVFVEDSDGNVFEFIDNGEGIYLSKRAFGAQEQIGYSLRIQAVDGTSFSSSEVTLPSAAEIDRVYAEKGVANGKTGISVFVDTKETSDGTSYFRYEYEEVFEVKLPHPSPFNYEIVDYSSFTKDFRIELENRRFDLVCYDLASSQGVIQASTQRLGEDNLLRFPVRFIDEGDPILRDRYSILVRQHGQSLEAFTFYRTLGDLGEAGNLLSQGQPGFVSGNIRPDSENGMRVMGFFEAVTVSEVRIEFNYEDFGLDQPPYFVECDHLISYEMSKEELYRNLVFEGYQIFFFEEKPINGSGPKPIYHISQSICSECASFTTHEKPDFWK